MKDLKGTRMNRGAEKQVGKQVWWKYRGLEITVMTKRVDSRQTWRRHPQAKQGVLVTLRNASAEGEQSVRPA